jgi:hypothetical protein
MLSGGYATGTLDTVIHSMLDKSRKNLIMASIKSNALMAWAFANDRVETEDGGGNITNPLIVGRNPNIASYQYYDQVPIGQTSEFNTIRYGWSRVAGTVIISDQEQDENQGQAALFKLLKSKLDILEESIKEKFSVYLYGSGSGTDPYGLAATIPDDPTTGTFGNIDRGAEQQWRTSAYQFSGALDATNIEEAFDDVLMDVTLKGERPDLILMGRNMVRIYRQAVRDKIVINISDTKNGKAMYDLGFQGFTHNGITCLYDEDCGVNRAYFINSKYLRLHMLKGVNMKVKELVAPWNVDAVGRRVVWQGQYCVWRAFRTHAVVRNGTTG